MNLKRNDMGEVTVLHLEGVLSGGKDAAALRAAVTELLEEGRMKLVLDLEKVAWINSFGLGTLHGCHTDARKAGGYFKITNVNQRVRHVMTVSRFDSLLESFDDVRGAVASFYH